MESRVELVTQAELKSTKRVQSGHRNLTVTTESMLNRTIFRSGQGHGSVRDATQSPVDLREYSAAAASNSWANFVSAFTHVPYLPGGVTDNDRVVGDVSRHDGSGTNKCMASDFDSAHDSDISADRGPLAHESGKELLRFLVIGNPWILVVSEHCVGSHKYTVAQDHTLPQRHPVLDGHVIPDEHF